MPEFLMPSLTANMKCGTLVEWLVKPGDTVRRGQVVAVVETTKGAIDVEILFDGVVEELLVPSGTSVPVGEPLALLRGHTRAPDEDPQAVQASQRSVSESDAGQPVPATGRGRRDG